MLKPGLAKLFPNANGFKYVVLIKFFIAGVKS